jgi:ketosteroid isomerase-like protein
VHPAYRDAYASGCVTAARAGPEGMKPAQVHGMTDLAALARRCFETYQTRDRETLEALLADDFTFTSPYDDHIDRATYFVRCWPNAGTYDKFELQHVIVHGDACWVTYEGHRRNGSWFRNTELLRFAGDQITSVEVFFGLPPHTTPTRSPVDGRSESSRS